MVVLQLLASQCIRLNLPLLPSVLFLSPCLRSAPSPDPQLPRLSISWLLTICTPSSRFRLIPTMNGLRGPHVLPLGRSPVSISRSSVGTGLLHCYEHLYSALRQYMVLYLHSLAFHQGLLHVHRRVTYSTQHPTTNLTAFSQMPSLHWHGFRGLGRSENVHKKLAGFCVCYTKMGPNSLVSPFGGKKLCSNTHTSLIQPWVTMNPTLTQ